MSDIKNDLAIQSVDNNILDRIAKLERQVTALSNQSIRATTLDEISSDMGIIRSGGFVASNDGYLPDEPEFTGTFMDATGFEFNDETYNIGGVDTGALMWGGNSSTGKFIFCGGNAQIDSDGISGTDLLKWLIRQSATYDEEKRYGQLGMEELDEKPAFTLSFYEKSAEDELVSNGDFATEDLTNWTKTTETNCAWSAFNYGGDYGYCAKVVGDSGGAITGVLTNDRVESVDSNKYYFSVDLYNDAKGTSSVTVLWYDHASAGSLLRTDAVCSTIFNSQFETFDKIITPPTGALSFAIRLNYVYSAAEENPVYFDNVSVVEIAVSNKLQLTDDDLLFNGDSVITDSTVYSGTYTPTLYETTNVQDSTAYECRYFRMGNMVIVSGQVNIDPTSAAATVLGMSLPIASTFSNIEECSGNFSTNLDSGRVFADTSNNRATFAFLALGTTERGYGFTFTYEII